MAAAATVVPNFVTEIVALFRFAGADIGAFPSGTPSGTLMVAADCKLDDFRESGGDTTKDFSTGQDVKELHRKTKNNKGLSGKLKFKHPGLFYKYWETEGPLVQVSITQTNATAGSSAFTKVYKLIMKEPTINYSDETVEFEALPYGQAETVTHGS